MTRPFRIGSTENIEGVTDQIEPDVKEAWDAALKDVVSENVSVIGETTSSISTSSAETYIHSISS